MSLQCGLQAKFASFIGHDCNTTFLPGSLFFFFFLLGRVPTRVLFETNCSKDTLPAADGLTIPCH